MNKALGFQDPPTGLLNYQPVKERGSIATGVDAPTDGTSAAILRSTVGQNALSITRMTAPYRDIRIKTRPI